MGRVLQPVRPRAGQRTRSTFEGLTAARLDQPLEFYLDTLAAIRMRTERKLRARDDDWLRRVERFEEVAASVAVPLPRRGRLRPSPHPAEQHD